MKTMLPKFYVGIPPHEVRVITEDGTDVLLDLQVSLKVRNHSPTGFSWGYLGSGPAQLALAILLDCVGQEIAEKNYEDFKEDFVANWNQDRSWVLSTTKIADWLRSHE